SKVREVTVPRLVPVTVTPTPPEALPLLAVTELMLGRMPATSPRQRVSTSTRQVLPAGNSWPTPHEGGGAGGGAPGANRVPASPPPTHCAPVGSTMSMMRKTSPDALL